MVTFLLVATRSTISATRVSVVAMLEPVLAALIAYLWLGETLKKPK